MKTDDELQALFEAPPRSRRFDLRRLLIALLALVFLAAVVAVTIVSRSQPEAVAQLRILDGRVGVVRSEAEGIVEAAEGDELQQGNSVRTDEGGQALVDFADGSSVRLDERTLIDFAQLAHAPRRVAFGLEGGRIWNRVSSGSERSVYEVDLGEAAVAVEGTTFLVDCRRVRSESCYVLGVEGTARVESPSGEQTPVEEDDCIKVHPSGATSRCNDSDIIDDWVRQNLAEDQRLKLEKLSSKTPSASEKPETSRPAVRAPRREPSGPAYQPPSRPATTPAPTAPPAPKETAKPKPKETHPPFTLPPDPDPTPRPKQSSPPPDRTPRPT